MIGGIHVPGVGFVPVRVRRSVEVHNPDGSSELRAFLDVDVPPPPGDGEQIPLAVAS